MYFRNMVYIFVFTCIISYAPWCWNIYQHLPWKSPSFVGKYTIHGASGYDTTFIELDDGKIETGKPVIFDGKHHGFRLRFSLKPIQWNMIFEHLRRSCFTRPGDVPPAAKRCSHRSVPNRPGTQGRFFASKTWRWNQWKWEL